MAAVRGAVARHLWTRQLGFKPVIQWSGVVVEMATSHANVRNNDRVRSSAKTPAATTTRPSTMSRRHHAPTAHDESIRAAIDALWDGKRPPGMQNKQVYTQIVEWQRKNQRAVASGPHRVVCGDSTDADTVKALLGDVRCRPDGDRPALRRGVRPGMAPSARASTSPPASARSTTTSAPTGRRPGRCSRATSPTSGMARCMPTTVARKPRPAKASPSARRSSGPRSGW